MSHFTTIETQIRDVQALKSACAEMSLAVELNTVARGYAGNTGPSKRLFMAELKSGDREGVVYKDLDAVWYAGRPASGGGAMKCKFWASC